MNKPGKKGEIPTLVQSEPLPSAELFGVFVRMAELSKYFRAYCYRPVEEMGFTLNEIDVLVSLKNYPEKNTVKGISESLRLSKGMISQAVESLRQKNLVAVSHSETDRRSVLIALNTKAQPVLEKIREAYASFVESFTSGIDREQLSLLETALSQIHQNKESMKNALRKNGALKKRKGATPSGTKDHDRT